MLLRTPDLFHTCVDLGTRLGALLDKQGMEIWKWQWNRNGNMDMEGNGNRNMKRPCFLGIELLNCHCYTFRLTRILSQTLPCQVNPVDTEAA